jgi:hypothetical protein
MILRNPPARKRCHTPDGMNWWLTLQVVDGVLRLLLLGELEHDRASHLVSCAIRGVHQRDRARRHIPAKANSEKKPGLPLGISKSNCRCASASLPRGYDLPLAVAFRFGHCRRSDVTIASYIGVRTIPMQTSSNTIRIAGPRFRGCHGFAEALRPLCVWGAIR